MFDYATVKVIWWLLVGVLLIGFAIMIWSVASSSTRWVPIGMGIRSGSSREAAQFSLPGRWCMPLHSVAFIGPCWWCFGRSFSDQSDLTIAARSKIRLGVRPGIGGCLWVVPCRRSYLAWRLATCCRESPFNSMTTWCRRTQRDAYDARRGVSGASDRGSDSNALD